MRFAALFFALSITACAQTCTADGIVTDAATGTPLAGVQVAIEPVPYLGTSTDADGKWILPGLRCENVRLSAGKTHYVTETFSVTEFHGIQTKLTVESTASGKVTDASGEGMAVAIEIYRPGVLPLGSEPRMTGQTRTDESGAWRMRLEPGEYSICVQSGGGIFPVGGGPMLCYPRRCSSLSVRPTQDARLDFTLTAVPAVHISGSIGGVPQGVVAVVELNRPGHESERPLSTLFTKPDGTFDFPQIIPDVYMIKATAASGEKTFFGIQDLAVGSGGLTNLSLALLPSVTVTGVVRFESVTGQLQPHAGVNLHPDGGSIEWDETGTAFTISNVAARKYHLEAGAPKFYARSIRVDGQDANGREIALTRPNSTVEIVLADDFGTIEGKVTDAAGNLGEAMVALFREGNPVMSIVTTRDGYIMATHVPPGHYLAYATEARPWRVPGATDTPTEIEVKPLGTTNLSLVRIAAHP